MDRRRANAAAVIPEEIKDNGGRLLAIDISYVSPQKWQLIL
jgi:hypothetical protein